MISPIVPAAKPASPAELNTRWELLVCPTGTQDAPAIVQLCGWLAEAAPGNVATATASPKQITELFLNFDILASIDFSIGGPHRGQPVAARSDAVAWRDGA